MTSIGSVKKREVMLNVSNATLADSNVTYRIMPEHPKDDDCVSRLSALYMSISKEIIVSSSWHLPTLEELFHSPKFHKIKSCYGCEFFDLAAYKEKVAYTEGIVTHEGKSYSRVFLSVLSTVLRRYLLLVEKRGQVLEFVLENKIICFDPQIGLYLHSNNQVEFLQPLSYLIRLDGEILARDAYLGVPIYFTVFDIEKLVRKERETSSKKISSSKKKLTSLFHKARFPN